jgi:hypothetical protein
LRLTADQYVSLSPPKVWATPSFNRIPFVLAAFVSGPTALRCSNDTDGELAKKRAFLMAHPQKTTNTTNVRGDTSNGAVFDVADWVALSATPVFGIMALLTAVVGGGAMDMHASPLTGMVTMYLLMGIFHSVHWLKLFSSTGHR